MKKGSRKLKTLQREAKEQGLQTILVPEQVAINPKTGKVVKLRNRNTLYILGKEGEVKFNHMSGIPRAKNGRAEEFIKELNGDDTK